MRRDLLNLLTLFAFFSAPVKANITNETTTVTTTGTLTAPPSTTSPAPTDSSKYFAFILGGLVLLGLLLAAVAVKLWHLHVRVRNGETQGLLPPSVNSDTPTSEVGTPRSQ